MRIIFQSLVFISIYLFAISVSDSFLCGWIAGGVAMLVVRLIDIFAELFEKGTADG